MPLREIRDLLRKLSGQDNMECADEDDVPLREIRYLLRKLPGQDNVECADVQEWGSIDKDLVFLRQ